MMNIKSNMVLVGLEWYLDLYGISLSNEARETLYEVEEFACRCNNPSNHNLFLSKAIKNSKIIQGAFIKNSFNPKLVAFMLEKDYYENIDKLANYVEDEYNYLQIADRKRNEKTAIIDRALEYCIKDNRGVLENLDIFLAAMDDYENILVEDTSYWVDRRLNTPYVTFSHVCGHYDENLGIKFEDIKEILLSSEKENSLARVS